MLSVSGSSRHSIHRSSCDSRHSASMMRCRFGVALVIGASPAMRSSWNCGNPALRLAPCGKHFRRFEEADGDRPHHASRRLALLVRIVELQLSPRCESPGGLRRDATPFPIRRVRRRQPTRRRRILQLRRQHRRDLGEHVSAAPPVRRRRAAKRSDRPKITGVDFIRAEHQRRQEEAGLQHIAQPLARPRSARPGPAGCDVSIERADAIPELVGQRLAAHRPPACDAASG